MQLRVLDLDGSLRAQTIFLERLRPKIHDFRYWGPRLRLACGFGKFKQFESALTNALGSAIDAEPHLNFLGSGDFHHVSLALLRRIQKPFNLLILDKHPDWMRGIPFLHCGTWLHHVADLPNVRKIFLIGGDVDFDNPFRWLAPWVNLRSGKIQVIPAVRRFQRGRWAKLALSTLRMDPRLPASRLRVDQLLAPFAADLVSCPLYVSLDKDVLTTKDAIVNWDSGHLTLAEVQTILRAFLNAADYQLAGMDIVGDWSPVRLRGLGRRILHLTEHPRLDVSLPMAARRNERTNLDLAAFLQKQMPGVAQVPALRMEALANHPGWAFGSREDLAAA